MPNILRSLVLHHWAEAFDASLHPEFLEGIVNISGILPTKITYQQQDGGKERRRTVSRSASLTKILAEAESYDWITLETPINGNFSNVSCNLTFRNKRKSCRVSNGAEYFSIGACVEVVKLVCRFVTPAYGFAYLGEGIGALTFGFGTTTTTMDEATWVKARDLGWSLRTTKEHLQGKLHDVSSLNVLSDLHLDQPVQDRPLRSWIEAGDRGELIKIKDNVTIWLVPDSLRRAIAAILREAGALMTPAWIPPGSGTV